MNYKDLPKKLFYSNKSTRNKKHTHTTALRGIMPKISQKLLPISSGLASTLTFRVHVRKSYFTFCHFVTGYIICHQVLFSFSLLEYRSTVFQRRHEARVLKSAFNLISVNFHVVVSLHFPRKISFRQLILAHQICSSGYVQRVYTYLI